MKEPQKNNIRIHFILMWIAIICTLLYYAHVLTQPLSPFQPRDESYAPFERHYHFGWKFPYITTYFLMLPEGYDASEQYPLVMMLHGVSRHMDGGKDLMEPSMRENYRVIAIIPIAPLLFRWAHPYKDKDPLQALPIAMDVLKSVTQKHSVDQGRIYLTGYSMGGEGVYGALCRYHGIFAAAAPLDAPWDPAQADKIENIPLWVFQGETDGFAPLGRKMAEEMALQKLDVQFTEYPMGHGAWTRAYKDTAFWSWLMAQEK